MEKDNDAVAACTCLIVCVVSCFGAWRCFTRQLPSCVLRNTLRIPKTLYLFLISEVFYSINKLRHRVLSSYKLYMSHQKLLCHQLMDTIYH